MKKTILGLLTAMLMTVGLVSYSGAPAQAQSCPYTGCVATKTSVTGPRTVKAHHKSVFNVAVVTFGSARPKGKVALGVVGTGPRRHFRFTKVVNFFGTTVRIGVPGLRKGTYKVAAAFKPKAGTSYKQSASKIITLTVKPG